MYHYQTLADDDAWAQLESVTDTRIYVIDEDGIEVHRGSLFEFCAANGYSPQETLNLRADLYAQNGCVMHGGGASPPYTIFPEPILFQEV